MKKNNPIQPISLSWLFECALAWIHATVRSHWVILDMGNYPYCADCRKFRRR